jgi:hypothetical protein
MVCLAAGQHGAASMLLCDGCDRGLACASSAARWGLVLLSWSSTLS